MKNLQEWKEELRIELEGALTRLEAIDSKAEAIYYQDFFESNVNCFIREVEDLV